MMTTGRPTTTQRLPSVRELESSALYTEELGIDLAKRKNAEIFLWFLASILFGARISEKIATNTYHAFVHHGLTTPVKILEAGWKFLVNPVMREGGYVRYDGRKSTQILRNCQTLLDEYRGKMSQLEAAASDSADLETRLKAFYGVGPVTVNIFLREMRPFWAKADPTPLPVVRKLAKMLELDLDQYDRHSLTFVRLEAGLIRLRHQLL